MQLDVIPLNDDKEHARSINCWCKPKVTFENGNAIVAHNSADGREWVEREIGEGVADDKLWGIFKTVQT